MMYGAMGLTYSGSMFSLYSIENETTSAVTQNQGECAGDSAAIGTSATNGPDFTSGTGLQISHIKPIIIDACYEITAAELLPSTSDFGAGTAATDAIVDEATNTSVTQIKFNDTTAGVTMSPYTDAFASGTAASCGGTAGTAREAEDTSPGYQCTAAVGALTTGFANKANTDLGVVDNVNYVTVEKYGGDSAHTATAGGLCSGTADVVQGRNRDYWPVIPDEYTATLANGSDAVGAGLYVNLQAGFCFSNNYDAANSNAGPTTWNLVCSSTNGMITYTQGTNLECDWATASNETSAKFTKNDKCVNTLAGNTTSWNIMNSDVEWEAICPTFGVSGGTTGVKTLKVYSTTTTLAQAAATLETAMTGAGVTGSRDIMLGLCYTATADGEIGGFVGGPFSDGTTDTEPIADKGSYMWVESVLTNKTTEVELRWWASTDCSGHATTGATAPCGGTATDCLDDGHDGTGGWPFEGFAVFDSSGALVTGTASAAGTTVAQLTALTKYITVKRHTDTTTTNAVHGAEGVCLGGGTEVQGRILDHFVLGNCHVHTGSATAANQRSYKWHCDTTTGNIKYDVYVGEDCTGTASATDALVFTKAAAVSAVGGKCLQVGVAGSDVSWEIRNDDTQWDAMCSVASSSSDDDDDDSSAGKIAATVAAGAAAAAALLI